MGGDGGEAGAPPLDLEAWLETRLSAHVLPCQLDFSRSNAATALYGDRR